MLQKRAFGGMIWLLSLTSAHAFTRMAKKNVPIHIPLQMGFGFEVQDSHGRTPQFLHSRDEVFAALDLIQQAHWVSVDCETTGLTDASVPVQLDTAQIRQQSASNLVRMRTIQARVPTLAGRKGPRENFAFDCDKMGPALTQEVAHTILSRKMFIAHNAGFDLYWLRLADGRRTMPAMVVDTMLLTRLLRPELVLKRAELISSIRHISEVQYADALTAAAWKSLISGASGGSLADVVLAMFEQVVDKTYQKPTNWTGLLSFEHYDYAIDDVIWADRILCELLGLDFEGDLYKAYLGQRARKFTVRLVEPQVPELVELRENGMPINTTVGDRYVHRKRSELATKVEELISIEPTLEAHRDTLANPDAGLDDALKKTLAHAFEVRGVMLRRTAATGSAQVGEKDLRACKAAQITDARPLFNAWVAVCRAKKSSNMALEVNGFAKRSNDSRLRSLLSHGPVTGRLSAAEPNCFTGATEILTRNGWVRFDELSKDVEVAQYENGLISFVKPLAYIDRAFSGELIRNASGTFDLLTTPEHRCLLVNAESGQEAVFEAAHYPDDHLQLHAASYLGGAGLPMTNSELRLLVVLQANGRWHNGQLQLKLTTTAEVLRARGLLQDCAPAGAPLLAEGVNGLPASLAVAAFATQYLGESLSFGPWLLSLSRAQLDIVLDELEHWPLCCAAKMRTSSVPYAAKRKLNADWVQTLYALSGRHAQLSLMTHADPRIDPQWRVSTEQFLSSSLTHHRKQTRVPYSGHVYCVSVPSGFILVRHNDKVMVTGNCQQFPRDQLFRAMCVSDTKPGCDTLEMTVTEVNQKFVSSLAERELSPGDTVTVDSAWTAAMFWADKYIPDWPAEERKALEQQINNQFTHTVVASDFGALDVRVGAALCIRSQRQMLALADGHAVPGLVQPPLAVVEVIRDVARLLEAKTAALSVKALDAASTKYKKEVEKLEARLEKLKQELDAGTLARKKFFEFRSELKGKLLAARMGYRFAQCLALGMARGEKEYSALRDAFVADIDIHTFTGMKLVGRDPMKEFEGLSVPERKALEKKLKKELGPRRQQGKIANLSLLYGMADAGFQEAAARGYDEHWSLEEAGTIRALWMDAYPEVELWHLWTECLQAGVVYLPEQGREKPVRTGWWLATTLAGRDIVAFGLNAALSYQDQSSGADILGLIMHRLKVEYPHIFSCSINQVHDEVVFCWPSEHHDEYLPIVEMVMVEEANSLTMPYGVPTAVSPASGPIWVKD